MLNLSREQFILIDLPSIKLFFSRKILAFWNLLHCPIRFFLSHKKPNATFNYSPHKKNYLSPVDKVSLSKIKKTHTGAALCCIWHIYKPNDVKHFLGLIRDFSMIDHFATFNSKSCGAEFLEHLIDLRSMSHLSLYPVTNRGRDYRMTTKILYDISQGNYRYLSKLHFKERDHLTHEPLPEKESIHLIRRHIRGMQILDSRKDDSMVFYGLKSLIIEQGLYLGENELWLKKLSRRARLSYKALIHSQFVSGGMFVISAPKNLLMIHRLIKDQEFEVEYNKRKFDGLLCHALERFFIFFAISKGYKLSYLPGFPSFLSRFFLPNKTRWH